MPGERGPVVRLIDQTPTPPYDPMADSLQWLVDDDVRLQRGPLAGTSGRSIHVGNPNGINYSFDPRLLAVVKIWQGGFLDMDGRAGQSRQPRPGAGLRQPRDRLRRARVPAGAAERRGPPVDFSFKEGKFGDFADVQARRSTAAKTSWRASPRWTRSSWATRAIRATSSAAPVFRYRVGKNVIETSTTISAQRRAASARERQAGDAAVVRVQSAAARGRHA